MNIDEILKKIYTSDLLTSEELHILTEWIREPKERIDEAIEFIKKYEAKSEIEEILLEILEGDNNDN